MAIDFSKGLRITTESGAIYTFGERIKKNGMRTVAKENDLTGLPFKTCSISGSGHYDDESKLFPEFILSKRVPTIGLRLKLRWPRAIHFKDAIWPSDTHITMPIVKIENI